jgi:hypothetical protein
MTTTLRPLVTTKEDATTLRPLVTTKEDASSASYGGALRAMGELCELWELWGSSDIKEPLNQLHFVTRCNPA